MRLTLPVFALCLGFLALASSSEAAEEEPRVVRVLLKGDSQGELDSILLDGKPIDASPDGKLSRFDVLQARVRSLVENPDGTRKAEEFTAEIEVNQKNLKHKYISQTIIAVTRYKRDDREEPVLLIEKVKIISSK